MHAVNDSSESTNLVSPSGNTKPSYMNLINNSAVILFNGIIIYCCFRDGVSLFSFHPILMSIGWLAFMCTAVNAITPGDFATEWMPIRLRSARHWVLQLVAATFVLTGFIVILTNKIINGKPHFVSLHAKFGLAAIIFIFLTSIGGLATLYSLKIKDYLAPIYIKVLHALGGSITLCLGVIAIILGNFSNWWSFGDVLRYFSIILVLTVLILTLLRPSLKIYFRLKERLGYLTSNY